MAGLRSVVAWLPVSILLAGACGDDETAPVGTTGAGAMGGAPVVPPFAGTPCASCLFTECASLEAICRAEPECALHLDCLFGCPAGEDGSVDPACRDACPPPSSPTASAALADWSVCAGASAGCEACGHATPLPNPYAGQECSVAPPAIDEPCTICFWEKCCDTFEACYQANPECDALFVCVDDCQAVLSTAVCHTECFAQHPDGVLDYLKDFACSDVMCGGPNDCGGQWPTTACEACGEEHCGGPISACLENASCFLAILCISECYDDEGYADPACVGGCVAALPPAELALFEAWRICSKQECFAECGGG